MSEFGIENYAGFEPERDMNKLAFSTTLISDRLDFGHGQISAAESEPSMLILLDETIRRPEILVPIDTDDQGRIIDDDGCGDGRGTKLVFTSTETYKRSLNRAKVFGGAVTMTAAGLIGTGGASNLTLPRVFSRAIDLLEAEEIDFGAHTDEQAHGDNCGCGAIDKAPEAVMAALKYEDPIRESIKLLGADTSELDVVYSNWRDYVTQFAEHPDYSGRKVTEGIISRGKVVKQLAGGHREKAIVLNTVPAYTVDQEFVRQATGGQAQTFAVDIWRLQRIAANSYNGQTTRQNQAYLSKLVYTLAVSAVLTKGDLPVYMTQADPQIASTY